MLAPSYIFNLVCVFGSDSDLHTLKTNFPPDFKICTVSTVKTETSKKNCQQKRLFFPDFFSMCCPCPFPQLDGISACFDNILPSKTDI